MPDIGHIQPLGSLGGDDTGARDAPPELNLDIPDDKLVEFIDAYSENSKTLEEEINLSSRRDILKRFYWGKQISTDRVYQGVVSDFVIPTYQTPIVDNILKEGIDKLRPLVLSRMPEFIVKPGVEGDDLSEQTAEGVSDLVNNALTTRELKAELNTGFKHHETNLIMVFKWRWDPQKGKHGDFVVEAIHPRNIRLDMTAKHANQEEMKIIIHYVEYSLGDWIMLFPKKEAELIEFAKRHGMSGNGLDEESKAVKLRLEEVWFDWKDKAKDFDPEDPKFDFKLGVTWKADKVILDKREDPNWDHNPTTELFFEGQPIPEELLPQVIALQQQGQQLEGIEEKEL